MAEVLVTGVTGKQGGAVARRLVRRGHTVAGYCRSAATAAARAARDAGVEIREGDLDDREALDRAAAGVDAIFGVTVPFGAGGVESEIRQGRNLISVAAARGAFLVHSSVRGAHRPPADGVAHARSKSVIESELRASGIPATVLAPCYFMENLLDVAFTRLRDGILALPLTPDRLLDQVTVADIAGMVVHAVECPDELAGRRIELASDAVTGTQAAAILSRVLGREVPYRQLPLEQVRRWAGADISAMFQRLEETTEYVDTDALRAAYPQVGWHRFADWARTVDWDTILAPPSEGR